MSRLCAEMLVCCRCGGAISLAIGPRRRPANTNLHAKRARKAITDRTADVIQIHPEQEWTTCQSRFQSKASERLTPPNGVLRAADTGRLSSANARNNHSLLPARLAFPQASPGSPPT